MYSKQELGEKVMIESAIDTDWYLIDNIKQMAVVASGGGLIPDTISKDMPLLSDTIKYFRSFPILSDQIIIEEEVLNEVKKITQQQRDNYLRDLYTMVSRGFYYYDKVLVNNFMDFRYYLKARPVVPLLFDELDSKFIGHMMSLAYVNKEFQNLKYFFVDKIV